MIRTTKNTSPLYEFVLPVWHLRATQKADFEIISKDYSQLALFFPKTQQTVFLGQAVQGELVPRCLGIYQVEDKVIVSTCLEHSRGASLHDFEVFILDTEGRLLYSQSIEIDTTLVRSAKYLFWIIYPQRYLGSVYSSPLLYLYQFELESLACTTTPIDAPLHLQQYYIRRYVRFLTANWDILAEKASVVCHPWLQSQLSKESPLPSLRFEYLLPTP